MRRPASFFRLPVSPSSRFLSAVAYNVAPTTAANAMNDNSDNEDLSQWWFASIGDTLVWARMRVLESGDAEVFDCDGNTLAYADEDGARAALLDAEFRDFDGIDEDDANLFGFSLEELEPPRGDSDEELVAQMTHRLNAKN